MGKLNEYRVTIKSRKGTVGGIDADLKVDPETAYKVLELLRQYKSAQPQSTKQESR